MKRLLCFYAVMVCVALTGCGGAQPYSHSIELTSPNQSAPPVNNPVAIPMNLKIPSIGVNSNFVAPSECCDLDDDQILEPPDVKKPMDLGWYKRFPAPGDTGAAIVLGHINGVGGAGVFAKLGQMKINEQFEIMRSDNQIAVFTVTKTTGSKGIDKGNFPTKEVYDTPNDAEIRLISCGGRLDKSHHRYLDQIIVWGKLKELKPA